MPTPQPDADRLIARYLPAAWRLALVSTDDPTLAEEATVAGVAEAITTAEQEGTEPTGTGIVAAARRAVLAKGAAAEARRSSDGDVAVAAFRALGEKARAAVWLTEVEGGTPDQVAPVLGLHPEAAAPVCERASATLRANLAADLASRATDDACRSALGRLHLHATGRLPDGERRDVSVHLAACRSCAALLAVIVSPRSQLLGLAADVPVSLAPSVAARLADRPPVPRRALAPLSRKTLGAAAAAVVALGVGVGALLGGGGAAGAGPELAAPAGVELSSPIVGAGGTLATPRGPSVAALPISIRRPNGVPTSTPVRAIDRARSLGSLPPESPPPGGPATPGPTTEPTSPTDPVAPATSPPTDGAVLVPGTTIPLPDPLPDLVVPELGGSTEPSSPVPCTGNPELDALTGCTPSTTVDALMDPVWSW